MSFPLICYQRLSTAQPRWSFLRGVGKVQEGHDISVVGGVFRSTTDRYHLLETPRIVFTSFDLDEISMIRRAFGYQLLAGIASGVGSSDTAPLETADAK